jgi:polyisoprenoid-binding protein YceI
VDLTGDIEADVVDGRVADAFEGRLEVPIAKLQSGNRLYDSELQRVTEARRYPTIVGEVRGAVADGDGRFRVDGDLTFHGVTRRVSDDLQVRAEGDRLVVEGRHQFDIREFGVTPPRLLMLKVHPTVTVSIKLVAEPA